MPGCGTVLNRQLVASRPIAAATKLGIWMNGCVSCPPASITHVVRSAASPSRAAKRAPDEPAPTTM
jgi:hypothetical protein